MSMYSDMTRFRFRVRGLLLLLAVFAFGLALIITVKKGMFGSDPRGPVVSLTKWPEPLRDFFEDASKQGLGINDHSLYRSSEVDYFFFAQANERLRDFMKRRWFLQEADHDHLAAIRFMEQVSLNKFELDFTNSAKFYVSKGWTSGEEGNLYVLIFDRHSKRIALWYYFNF